MSRKKILIVDDELALVEMIKMRLEASDYEVITASDGIEGLEKIRAEQPDMIILDILMPRMSGYELLRTLRKEKGQIKDTPVLIISARGRMKGLFDDMDISDFIGKPFDAQELMKKIDDIISKEEQRKAEQKKVLLIGRDKETIKMLVSFLGAQSLSVVSAKTGAQGIEKTVSSHPDLIICQAILEDMNAPELCRIVRGMSGMSEVPFVIFSSREAAFVVEELLPHQELIEYAKSEELLKKLERYLKKNRD